jgi:hypothetical protein
MIGALAIFALIVSGLHAGADRFDDLAFSVINVIDALVDDLVVGLIASVGGFFGAAHESIEAASYRAAELIDLDAKLALSKELALGLELFADVILALPLLDPRAGKTGKNELLAAARGAVIDPSIIRFCAPLAAGAAAIAGVAVVTRETAVAFGELASWLAKIGAGAALIATAILAARAITRALVRGDVVMRADLGTGTSPVKRRFRGVWTFAIALPLALVAAIDGEIYRTAIALVTG